MASSNHRKIHQRSKKKGKGGSDNTKDINKLLKVNSEEKLVSSTHLRLHSPNNEAWEPDIRLLQSSSNWLSQYGLAKLKLTIEQILPTIGFKHSDEYVRPLRKPVSSRYAEGLFSKVPHKSGSVYNLIATRDKLKMIETQLKQATSTFKKRLEWLTSESRRIFGVIEERSIAIILDVQATSRSQLEMYIQSLVQVLKEQVMFISKFNLIRAAVDMLCWQEEAVTVTMESIDSALNWLLKQQKSVQISSTSVVEAILKAMSDDQVQAVYLFTEGTSSDSSKEILKRKAKEYNKPLHVVSLNCSSPSTIAELKRLTEETKGRFHAFSMFDDDIDRLENFSCSSDVDSDSGTDLNYKSQRSSNSRPPTKIGYGVRRDVMLMWSELDNAREVLSKIQALIVEVEQPRKEVHFDDHPKQHTMSMVESKSELYMSSKEWLKIHGIRGKRLGFYEFLETVAFKHCDGVVGIPTSWKRNDGSDVVTQSKLVNARYCDRFAHVRWKDGRIMHVHISGPMHQNYAQKMMVSLENYRKRLDWLQQGSRELFGTIIEDKVTILIDTSSSMASRLFIVKDKLYRLMQEQLRNKKKFNIIKFDSKILPWRENLVNCTEQNLENAWHWVKKLTTGGSTNTLGVLKRALSDVEVEGVYLLTDGRPDQPPSTVIAQANLMNSVPVHTISFNCADSEANEFLSQLAKETGGRYHYFSEDANDESGPTPFESEDIRLIREEIEEGLRDLEKVENVREECTRLDWCGSENKCTRDHDLKPETRKGRPLSAYGRLNSGHIPSPPQVERPVSAQPISRRGSSRVSSRSSRYTYRSPTLSPNREIPVIHTRSSELRMSFLSRQASESNWMLPESREYLSRRSRMIQSKGENKKKKKKRKAAKAESGSTPIQRWLKKNSLAARKLTIVDAMAPTMIPHSTKYVPILDKHVLSKVFDQVLPLAHTSGSSRTEVQIVNPQAVDLVSYEEKLKRCMDEFEWKLNKTIFGALSESERLKYQSEGIPSFSENRKSMLVDLEENDWPVSLKDIGSIEREIKQAEIYLKQSKELRETSQKLAKEAAEKQKAQRKPEKSPNTLSKISSHRPVTTTRSPSVHTYRWSRNQRVVARNELDGFYYPGVVHKCLNSRFVEVDFDNGIRQVTPGRYILSTGGSRPCPVLRIGDYVLARASIPRQQGDDFLPDNDVCYVPALVQVTPLREKSALKCYTVIRYNGKKVTVVRNDMIKISRARFVLACRFIRDAEKTAVKGESPAVIYPSGDTVQTEKDASGDESSTRTESEDSETDGSSASTPRSNSTRRSQSSMVSPKGSRCSSRSSQHSKEASATPRDHKGRSRQNSETSAKSRSRSQSTESNKNESLNGSKIDLDFLEETSQKERKSEEDTSHRKGKEKKRAKHRKSRRNDDSESSDSSETSRSDIDMDQNVLDLYSEQKKKLHETQEKLEQLQKQFEGERELYKQQQQAIDEKRMHLQEKQQELLQKQLDEQQDAQNRLQKEQRRLQDQQEDLLRKQKEQQENLLQQQYNQNQALHLQKQQLMQQEAKRLRDQHTETERNIRDQTTETEGKQYRDVDTSPSQSILSLKEYITNDEENQGQDEPDAAPQNEAMNEKGVPNSDDNEGAEPQLKMFFDDDKEAFLLTKGSHGLLVSRQPPDNDPAVTTQNIPRPIQVNDKVLARWPDDGWYYKGTIRQDCNDTSYFVEDSVGDLERINRTDIITDDDDVDNIINAGDPVIGLHPSFTCGYAPGIVLAFLDTNVMEIRYYDGHEAAVPREELYLISPEKFERDCSFVLACEDSLVGQAVIARNDEDGKFYLGSVRERVSGARNYLIEWADQSLQIQNYAYIFGAHTKRHQLTKSNPVLAIADQASFTYLPGKIMDTNGQKLVVKFCSGTISSQVDAMQSFWVSPDYYEQVVKFYLERESTN